MPSTETARATPAKKKTPTQASSVHDRLQQDILSGQLQPGGKLRLKELIERYKTGNSPLREALNRLSSNGLVVREENRGFTVAHASMEELQELIKTRCWLEETALKESIAHGDKAWEEQIVLAFHWLSQTDEAAKPEHRGGNPDWAKHHSGFHRALISACNSSILLDFCDQLQRRTYRYRNLAEVVKYRDRHELNEHAQIKEAVLARDSEKAVRLLREHFTATLKILSETGSFE